MIMIPPSSHLWEEKEMFSKIRQRLDGDDNIWLERKPLGWRMVEGPIMRSDGTPGTTNMQTSFQL